MVRNPPSQQIFTSSKLIVETRNRFVICSELTVKTLFLLLTLSMFLFAVIEPYKTA